MAATHGMTQDDIIAFVTALPATVVTTAREGDGSPDIAWGDTFVFHAPDGTPATAQRMPFATIVTKDYPGFDTASDLDRPGFFRLNIGVGRAAFEELLGYPPAAHAEHADGTDYAATDRLIPHPVYAAQGWVAVVNPGPATAGQVKDLLTAAGARAAERHRRVGS